MPYHNRDPKKDHDFGNHPDSLIVGACQFAVLIVFFANNDSDVSSVQGSSSTRLYHALSADMYYGTYNPTCTPEP